MKLFTRLLVVFATQLLFSMAAFAASLTITPNGSATKVTAGIPFAACALASTSNFKLVDELGAEVPIFIKSTLMWPAGKCAGVSTIRSVKIQFVYNPAQGSKVYNWAFAPRSLTGIAETAVSEVNSANAAKAGFKEPAFYAVSDPAYLVTSGIIAPTAIATSGAFDTIWYPAIFADRVTRTDFSTTLAVDWLFDSVSSLYQQALRTGAVAQYREAYLEHEFWISKMKVADPVGAVKLNFCIGGFNFGGEAMPYTEAGNECDEKYTYLTPMKLHLALTGDDSWVPSEGGVTPSSLATTKTALIQTIAARAFTSDWTRTAGIIAPYTDIAAGFTERSTGLSLQRQVAAYEMTLDATILANIKTTINNLYGMLDSNPDGLGNHEYLSHSWSRHEGDVPPYIGMSPSFTGATTQTFTSMIISSKVADDYLKLQTNATIFFKPYGPYTAKLAGPATLNGDGTYTLTFTAPVTVQSNQWVMVVDNPNGVARESFLTDRVFSPWMTSNISDGLWSFYQITDDTAIKAKIEEMLLSFGHAITSYAFDGTGMKPATRAAIESAFGVTVVDSGAGGGRGGLYMRYFANYLLTQSPVAYSTYLGYDGNFSDQHTPEALFQLSLAINFETNAAKKAAMKLAAYDLLWYFNATIRAVGSGDGYPTRYFNWTNKPNPFGTYAALAGGALTYTGPEPSGYVPPPPTPEIPPAGPELPGGVFVEDAAPPGASLGTDGDAWTWISSNPTPYSGALAHQSNTGGGMHQHFFNNATTGLTLFTGDVITTWVYLDPIATPTEIMLQLSNGSWEHRAYWGANSIGFGVDNTDSKRYMGPLPLTGQWVKLEVPVAQVGLANATLVGIAYATFGGRATWDLSGKYVAPVAPTFSPEMSAMPTGMTLIERNGGWGHSATSSTWLDQDDAMLHAWGVYAALEESAAAVNLAASTANATLAATRLTALNTATALNTTLQDQVTTLTASVATLTTSVSTATAAKVAAETALATATTNLTTAQNDLAASQLALSVSQTNLATATSSVNSLQSLLTAANAAVAAKEVERAAAAGLVAAANAAKAVAESALAAAQTQLANAAPELVLTQAALATATAELTEARADLFIAEGSLHAIELELTALEAELLEAQSENASMAELMALQTAYDSIELQLETKTDELNEIHSAIQLIFTLGRAPGQ